MTALGRTSFTSSLLLHGIAELAPKENSGHIFCERTAACCYNSQTNGLLHSPGRRKAVSHVPFEENCKTSKIATGSCIRALCAAAAQTTTRLKNDGVHVH